MYVCIIAWFCSGDKLVYIVPPAIPRAAVTANSTLASLRRYWPDSRPRHCSRAHGPIYQCCLKIWSYCWLVSWHYAVHSWEIRTTRTWFSWWQVTRLRTTLKFWSATMFGAAAQNFGPLHKFELPTVIADSVPRATRVFSLASVCHVTDHMVSHMVQMARCQLPYWKIFTVNNLATVF